MLFSKLGLSAELLRAIEQNDYREATPVQAQAIPLVLAGHDLLAGAQTGTGKTAGFVLPLLKRLQDAGAPQRRPRALILAPTRELAAQVGQSVATYGRHLPFQSLVIHGGVNINPQIRKLREGVDILIATPGRLLDHMGQGTVDLRNIEVLILDEADRMLDMGFIHDIKRLLKVLPEKRQNLLFSATFSNEIRRLAADLLNQPREISVTPRNTTAERVSQVVYPVDKTRKRELLAHRIGAENWRQVLVFTRTKHGANRLAQQLDRDGIQAAAIHGNKSQGARNRALSEFKSGKVRVLVATDIAARGLDIQRLPYVVNYELPFVAEDYVHRIGRTARAGHEGHAVSLVCVDEHKLLKDIERLLGERIEQQVIAGYEPDPKIAAQPLRAGGGGGGGGGRGRGRPQAGAARKPGGGSKNGRKPAQGRGRQNSQSRSRRASQSRRRAA